LADIAREAEVPLGNVYYYFKTKDEIGEAIVELRLRSCRAAAAMERRQDPSLRQLCCDGSGQYARLVGSEQNVAARYVQTTRR